MALPAVIAAVGLPILARLLAGGLSRLDHPAARGAAEALEGVGAAIDAREIGPAQVMEANRHLETIARIEAGRHETVVRQVNRTMRREIASDDAYVRRWRPTFGYAVAITWIIQMAGLTYAVVATPALAGDILAAMTHLSVIWGVALSVLGITVAKRSQDKALDAGAPAAAGGLEALGRSLARLAGGDRGGEDGRGRRGGGGQASR